MGVKCGISDYQGDMYFMVHSDGSLNRPPLDVVSSPKVFPTNINHPNDTRGTFLKPILVKSGHFSAKSPIFTCLVLQFSMKLLFRHISSFLPRSRNRLHMGGMESPFPHNNPPPPIFIHSISSLILVFEKESLANISTNLSKKNNLHQIWIFNVYKKIFSKVFKN